MIKTITLTANAESFADVGNFLNASVRNLGTATVYASAESGVTPAADNVICIKGGENALVRGICAAAEGSGGVWLLSASDCTVEVEGQDDTNFRQPSNLERIIVLEGKSRVYGVRFSGSSPEGVRYGAAENMRAEISLNGAACVNDFDTVPFYNRRICCCKWDAQGRKWKVNAYKGENGYAADGTNGEVMYECLPFYYRTDLNSFFEVSGTPLEGFTLAPMFRNGTDKVYCPSYWSSTVDGKATSRSRLAPTTASLNTHMAAMRGFDSKAHTETMKQRFSDYILQVVEFATKNLKSVMTGAYRLAVNNLNLRIEAVISPSRFELNAAAAGCFRAGQSIAIGSAYGDADIADNVIVRSCMDTGVVLESEVSGLAVGQYLTSRMWVNGMTDFIPYSSGTVIDNSGFYPCIWRGKCDPWGDACSPLCDVLIKRTAVSEGYSCEAYCLDEPWKYSGGTLTKDYFPCNMVVFGISSGYGKSFGADTRRSYVMLQNQLGADENTYTTAYYNQPTFELTVIAAGSTNGEAYGMLSPVRFSAVLPAAYSDAYAARLYLEE